MVVIGNFTHNFYDSPKDSVQQLEFENLRAYSTPDGIFPSVTTVVGWEKQKQFAEWRKKNAKESQRVCDRGTSLHSKIESYILNEEIDMSVDDELFSLIKKEVDHINNIRAIEQPLWGKIPGLAGRVDCIAEYKKELSVIDFKASTYPKKKADIDNYFCQATAYSLMWQERTGEPVPNIVILIANEQGFCQVYKEKAINFVDKLKKYIDTYKTEVDFDGIVNNRSEPKTQ
jgi:genome maintenance exonuclease 1